MVKIDEARTWIGAVVLLIIMAAIGVLIQSELYGSMKDSATTTNETTTSLTAGTPYSLVTGDTDFPADLSVTKVTNETNGVPYPENASNWHYNTTLGSITILSTVCSDEAGASCSEDFSNTNFNVTYSYTPGAIKTDVLKNGTLSISNVTKQMPTIGIIMGVLLIIGAVMLIAKYFGSRYTA